MARLAETYLRHGDDGQPDYYHERTGQVYFVVNRYKELNLYEVEFGDGTLEWVPEIEILHQEDNLD